MYREIETFAREYPQYEHYSNVDDWWRQKTGMEPYLCKGITVGIPVYNEYGSLRSLINDSILAARMPGQVPCTVILVTNGTTDGGDKLAENIFVGLAKDAASYTGDDWQNYVRRNYFSWPPQEYQARYEQEWYKREDGVLDREELLETSYSLPGSLTIIHINTKYSSKNNALNIIRQRSPTDEIISIDADANYHPYAFVELYGGLVQQSENQTIPVVTGLGYHYYDHHTLLGYIRRYRPVVPSVVHFGLWGGLFAYDRQRIPPFPVDLMYEDVWLREWCKKYFGGAFLIPHAIGVQRGVGTFDDEIGKVARSVMHRLQLQQLHPDDVTGQIAVDIANLYKDDSFTAMTKQLPGKSPVQIFFEIAKFERHALAGRLVRKRLERLQKDNISLSQLRTFDRFSSTKPDR